MFRQTLNDPTARNLVFKGGSVKGTAFIGVRAALEAFGFDFDALERVGGTSAGAITQHYFSHSISMQPK